MGASLAAAHLIRWRRPNHHRRQSPRSTSPPIEEAPLRRPPLLPLAILLLVGAPEARGQPPGPPPTTTAVVALYEEAIKAMEKGDYASACPKLEEVVRIDPARIGPKIELGNCYAAMGLLASAWTRYRLAEG